VREVTLALMDVDFTPKEGSNDVEIMLQLPAPYDVADVVISTVSIWGELFANPSYSVLEDRNGDGTRELYLRFDSVGFEKWAVQVDPLTVTLTGEVRDTVWFRGDEVVRFEVPELTYPDGGEFLISGESVSISWTECTGQSSRPVYEVWLSRDGSQTWTMLAGNVELDSFDWVVSGPITGQARVRVYAWEEGEVIGFSSSEEDFVIQLQLLPPAPLETLLVDKGPTDFSLTWQAVAVDPNHGPADFYRVLSSALAQGPFVEWATTVGTSLDLPISTQTGNFLHYRVVPQNTAGEPPN